MTLTKDKKTNLIGEYQLHGTDTGSPEVQIAILSERITKMKSAPRIGFSKNMSINL